MQRVLQPPHETLFPARSVGLDLVFLLGGVSARARLGFASFGVTPGDTVEPFPFDLILALELGGVSVSAG